MRRTVLAAVATALLLTGCTGKDESDKKAAESPEHALATAKKLLDSTSGVRLTLDSEGVASDATALLSAEGVLTDAPAFDGTIVVQVAGLEPKVPVVAVNDTVYAQLPLTSGWQEIDPAAYGAPDPADLMSRDRGLSSMLTATTGVTRGKAKRGGEGNKEVLTSYAGTLPASAVKVILPSVTGNVKATYALTGEDELRQAVLVGDFYGTGASETYTVTVEDYGTDKDIKAP
jgi:lipoprotein LprG